MHSAWLTGHTYAAGTLTLHKADGGALVHRDVPPWVPGLLHASRSPGRFYNHVIKPRFAFVATVGPEEPAEMTDEELHDQLRRSLDLLAKEDRP